MIETVNLIKKFKHIGEDKKETFKIAVNNITLTIGDNEIFGILGRNGAGKTTLTKLLTMQLSPTSGKIFYCGKSTEKNSA